MASSNNNRAPGGRQDKKCGICSRCFARSEHLARHRRTHTKEKPFACSFCRRSFQRADVKAAHVRRCHAAPLENTDGDARTEGLRSLPKRVRVACDSCRRRKMRCDGGEPCSACLSSSCACHYAPATASAEPSISSHVERSNDGHPSPSTLDLNIIGHNEHSNSLPFVAVQQPDFDVAVSLSTGTDLLQNTDHSALPLAGQGHSATPIYNRRASYEPSLSPSHEDTLYPFTDAGAMNDFWQMPIIDGQFWFDGSDLSGSAVLFDSDALNLDPVLSSSTQNLTSIMQEYFDRKSRAPSPSLNKASKMWYSSPPNLNDHNKDIVRVFLNIFQRHIGETFSIFKESTASRKNRAEYTLAMAATGGLFCTVSGSAEVAKSMYNDARRLLLASFNVRNKPDDFSSSPEDRLATVKTFILLELYGLCSGDKRSYEFVEAFHGNLIHSVQQYSWACTRSTLSCEKEIGSIPLLETLHILDCYRVIIMQRPPSLSWHHADSFAQSPSTGSSRIPQLQHLVAELGDSCHAGRGSARNESNLASLASLSAYLWPAIYPRQNSYGTDNALVESLSLWKADFVELACDKWLRSLGQTQDPSHLAMYHLMNIMLHANLTILQSFAHSAPGSAARDPNKSSVAREIHSWVKCRHYKIARWHAEHMIASIEAAFTASVQISRQPSSPHPTSRSSSSTTEPRCLPFEAPHVPYAIYYATLVLWCGAVTGEMTVSASASAQGLITRGERILSLHKVHIARLLARVLNEVR